MSLGASLELVICGLEMLCKALQLDVRQPDIPRPARAAVATLRTGELQTLFIPWLENFQFHEPARIAANGIESMSRAIVGRVSVYRIALVELVRISFRTIRFSTL